MKWAAEKAAIDDPAEAVRRGDYGRAYAEAHFSPSSFARSFEALIRNVTK